MTKSNKTFYMEKKQERYFKQKKKDNVRARSYYKLEKIDLKYNLIKENIKMLDLGSAPGAWLEYINKKLKNKEYELLGIDLLEVKKQYEFSDNIKVVKDDFKNVLDYVKGKDKEFDLILSDMAPEFCGDNQVDRGRCHSLNLKTLEFCEKHLKIGGTLVFKTFFGEDYDNYVYPKCKKMFDKIKTYKPSSSSNRSAEMFLICSYKF